MIAWSVGAVRSGAEILFPGRVFFTPFPRALGPVGERDLDKVRVEAVDMDRHIAQMIDRLAVAERIEGLDRLSTVADGPQFRQFTDRLAQRDYGGVERLVDRGIADRRCVGGVGPWIVGAGRVEPVASGIWIVIGFRFGEFRPGV